MAFWIWYVTLLALRIPGAHSSWNNAKKSRKKNICVDVFLVTLWCGSIFIRRGGTMLTASWRLMLPWKWIMYSYRSNRSKLSFWRSNERLFINSLVSPTPSRWQGTGGTSPAAETSELSSCSCWFARLTRQGTCLHKTNMIEPHNLQTVFIGWTKKRFYQLRGVGASNFTPSISIPWMSLK